LYYYYALALCLFFTVTFFLLLFFFFFFLSLRPPPISTLFPYTTLFRSCRSTAGGCLTTPTEACSRTPTSWASPMWSRSSASPRRDRKSTRLNSSHVAISYAVFCLKKKNTYKQSPTQPIKHPPILSAIQN